MNHAVIPGADHYLWAAYAAAWIIHGGYMLTLYNRSKRLERERRELGRN